MNPDNPMSGKIRFLNTMAEGDWLIRLFSRNTTLEYPDKKVQALSGASMLMGLTINMEMGSTYMEGLGCISLTNLKLLYGGPHAGMYKKSQLYEKLRSETADYVNIFYDLPEDGNIPAIKREYQSCVGSVDYFYIPLTLIPERINNAVRHANGILVRKSKGTYYRIEPQYSQEDPRPDTVAIYEGIEKALNEIGAKDFTRVELNETCPQHLTQDFNCLFWTAYTTREILRNIFRNQDPNTTIAQITRRGALVLNEEIRLFKENIKAFIPKFLAQHGLVWKEYNELKPQAPVAGAYLPPKYFRGLSTRKVRQRTRELTRRAKMSFKNPKAYRPFKTDTGVKTRRSSYTQRFHAKYPNAKTLPEIAKATGISKGILQTVYDRGMAAWRTGHRPGASQHAWGMARVHSFVTKGKTWRTADADLARKV